MPRQRSRAVVKRSAKAMANWFIAAIHSIKREQRSKDPEAPKELQHLMICFDGDPCYEFLCTDFTVC
jgi:hypothetical protein